MPDGTQDCGMILADLRELKRRMSAMEEGFKDHCRLETVEVGGIRESVEEIRDLLTKLTLQSETERAAAKAEKATYELIGQRLVTTVKVIVIAGGILWGGFHWYSTEGGQDWIQKNIR